jgi:hypothetical protein
MMDWHPRDFDGVGAGSSRVPMQLKQSVVRAACHHACPREKGVVQFPKKTPRLIELDFNHSRIHCHSMLSRSCIFEPI